MSPKPSWHKFECLGYKLVYDVASGSLHSVDEVGWDLLDSLEASSTLNTEYAAQALVGKYPPEVIREVSCEIANLISSGELGGDDAALDYKPSMCDSEGGMPVKAICLHVAHACNITCAYCFASEGSFGGKRELMSERVAHRAVDFLMNASLHRKHCELDFFGGEPLLNWDVVKSTTLYSLLAAQKADKSIALTLTTNGIALDSDKIDFLLDNEIALVLSLDGRASVNDRMRRYFGENEGNSVYDAIVPHFLDAAVRYGDKWHYVRGTFTRYNLDFSEDVKHLAELGFKHISVEPVVASPEEDFSLRCEDLPSILDEYEALALWLVDERKRGNPIDFFHFNLKLDNGPCLAKRVLGCGAGNNYMAITPTGELYPCHQFVGREELRLGSIFSGIDSPHIREEFAKCNLVSKESCRDCWVRYFCGGGCHANAHLQSGSLYTPYDVGCTMQRKRVECALAMQVCLGEV